jgi:uncharacterized Zn finger protein (UPF0148 family)
MTITTVSCSSCGAPIKIPEDVDFLNCVYCGAALKVQRGEGYVALKLAEQVSKSIQQVGDRTQATIREGTYATQSELKRLQITQEIASLQIQLSGIQAEIRSLERQKSNRKIKKQLRELRDQEKNLLASINRLQAWLTVKDEPLNNEEVSAKAVAYQPGRAPAPKDWSVTFLLCIFLGAFGIHRFYTGYTKIGLVQLFTLGGFGIWWMIDIILILAKKYKDASGQLLENANSRFGRSCASSFVTYIGIAALLTIIVIPLYESIFRIHTSASQSGSSSADPLISLAIWLAIFAAAIVFVYRYFPDMLIWKPLKMLFPKKQPGDLVMDSEDSSTDPSS